MSNTFLYKPLFAAKQWDAPERVLKYCNIRFDFIKATQFSSYGYFRFALSTKSKEAKTPPQRMCYQRTEWLKGCTLVMWSWRSLKS